MKIPQNLINLGFTKYEAQVYLSLVAENPLNGSQLSRASGVPRANIYNVLDNLKSREIVTSVGKNVFAPIPPDELFKRLRHQQDNDLSVLKAIIENVKIKTVEEYIWTITNYDNVIDKAREIISNARHELFVRLFPEEGMLLKSKLKKAEARGVDIKYVSLGLPPVKFKFQVIHPEIESLSKMLNCRTMNIVSDEIEVITGQLKKGPMENTSVAWAKNSSLALTTRDAMRHDFYHVFVHKIYELGEELSAYEKELYSLVKKDFWTSIPKSVESISNPVKNPALGGENE